ncbi:MAG TPA: hypothetical protein DCE42_06010 [Myxococcales bacterium]|nr:hypothetical protein [Deltaproteobacteria bacterium]MBU53630.1 hypothetical protein [Deltaproteobacteria bacterium]HAA54288.1 hypothetical protein [Myxococcales bacterium]|tara:strand:- start:20970 stop:21836 length:867 start_codon:yes stop_codon:yes gene_type:complete
MTHTLMSVRWGLVASIFFLLNGCFRVILPTFPHTITLTSSATEKGMKLHFYPQDQNVVSDVVSGLRQAAQRAQLWGPLQVQTHIKVFPNHQSLEEATARPYRWLRAWAMYDRIYLQSPRTWRYHYYQAPLQTILTHELTHVVMYQLCCTKSAWHKRHLPLWFREGMATVTAQERQYNWPWKKMRRYLRTSHGKKLMARPSAYLRYQQPLVYALGHWMFAVLVEKWKVKGVRKLLTLMRQGRSFAESFKQVTGLSQNAFKKFFIERSKSTRAPHIRTILRALQTHSPVK